MLTKGYDTFLTEPFAVEVMHCGVCGTACEVEREVLSAAGYREVFVSRTHAHDRFTCPNAHAAWHRKALALVLELEDTASNRVAQLIRLDLRDILGEHGIGTSF